MNPSTELHWIDYLIILIYFGFVLGIGFVLSFGYWCTDFLVVQRAMAADSMASARRTPLIAAVPKMLFPFLVILPGLLALGLTHPTNSGGPEGEKGAPPAAAVTATGPADLIPPETNPMRYSVEWPTIRGLLELTLIFGGASL
jgi:hypothetical protein